MHPRRRPATAGRRRRLHALAPTTSPGHTRALGLQLGLTRTSTRSATSRKNAGDLQPAHQDIGDLLQAGSLVGSPAAWLSPHTDARRRRHRAAKLTATASSPNITEQTRPTRGTADPSLELNALKAVMEREGVMMELRDLLLMEPLVQRMRAHDLLPLCVTGSNSGSCVVDPATSCCAALSTAKVAVRSSLLSASTHHGHAPTVAATSTFATAVKMVFSRLRVATIVAVTSIARWRGRPIAGSIHESPPTHTRTRTAPWPAFMFHGCNYLITIISSLDAMLNAEELQGNPFGLEGGTDLNEAAVLELEKRPLMPQQGDCRCALRNDPLVSDHGRSQLRDTLAILREEAAVHCSLPHRKEQPRHGSRAGARGEYDGGGFVARVPWTCQMPGGDTGHLAKSLDTRMQLTKAKLNTASVSTLQSITTGLRREKIRPSSAAPRSRPPASASTQRRDQGVWFCMYERQAELQQQRDHAEQKLARHITIALGEVTCVCRQNIAASCVRSSIRRAVTKVHAARIVKQQGRQCRINQDTSQRQARALVRKHVVAGLTGLVDTTATTGISRACRGVNATLQIHGVEAKLLSCQRQLQQQVVMCCMHTYMRRALVGWRLVARESRRCLAAANVRASRIMARRSRRRARWMLQQWKTFTRWNTFARNNHRLCRQNMGVLRAHSSIRQAMSKIRAARVTDNVTSIMSLRNERLAATCLVSRALGAWSVAASWHRRLKQSLARRLCTWDQRVRTQRAFTQLRRSVRCAWETDMADERTGLHAYASDSASWYAAQAQSLATRGVSDLASYIASTTVAATAHRIAQGAREGRSHRARAARQYATTMCKGILDRARASTCEMLVGAHLQDAEQCGHQHQIAVQLARAWAILDERRRGYIDLTDMNRLADRATRHPHNIRAMMQTVGDFIGLHRHSGGELPGSTARAMSQHIWQSWLLQWVSGTRDFATAGAAEKYVLTWKRFLAYWTLSCLHRRGAATLDDRAWSHYPPVSPHTQFVLLNIRPTVVERTTTTCPPMDAVASMVAVNVAREVVMAGMTNVVRWRAATSCAEQAAAEAIRAAIKRVLHRARLADAKRRHVANTASIIRSLNSAVRGTEDHDVSSDDSKYDSSFDDECDGLGPGDGHECDAGGRGSSKNTLTSSTNQQTNSSEQDSTHGESEDEYEWRTPLSPTPPGHGPGDASAANLHIDAVPELSGVTQQRVGSTSPSAMDRRTSTLMAANVGTGWQQWKSKAGDVYFHQEETGRSTWEIPEGAQQQEEQETSAVIVPPGKHVAAPYEDWPVVKDSGGHEYYENPMSGRRIKKDGDKWKTLRRRSAVVMMRTELPPGWVVMQDTQDGGEHTFYYNEDTKEHTFQRPGLHSTHAALLGKVHADSETATSKVRHAFSRLVGPVSNAVSSMASRICQRQAGGAARSPPEAAEREPQSTPEPNDAQDNSPAAWNKRRRRSTVIGRVGSTAWQTVKDENGDIFYWNAQTGAMQWERPVGAVLAIGADAENSRSVWDNRRRGSTQMAPMKGGWQQLKDASANVFYFNSLSGEARWARPEESEGSGGGSGGAEDQNSGYALHIVEEGEESEDGGDSDGEYNNTSDNAHGNTANSECSHAEQTAALLVALRDAAQRTQTHQGGLHSGMNEAVSRLTGTLHFGAGGEPRTVVDASEEDRIAVSAPLTNDQLVGRRIVIRAGTGPWLRGTVASFDSLAGTHNIQYDHGSEAQVCLDDMSYAVVAGAARPPLHVSKGVQVGTPNDTCARTADVNASSSGVKRAFNQWSSSEDTMLLDAMQACPASPQQDETQRRVRWRLVSARIPGRGMKDCHRRFREMKQEERVKRGSLRDRGDVEAEEAVPVASISDGTVMGHMGSLSEATGGVAVVAESSHRTNDTLAGTALRPPYGPSSIW